MATVYASEAEVRAMNNILANTTRFPQGTITQMLDDAASEFESALATLNVLPLAGSVGPPNTFHRTVALWNRRYAAALAVQWAGAAVFTENPWAAEWITWATEMLKQILERPALIGRGEAQAQVHTSSEGLVGDYSSSSDLDTSPPTGHGFDTGHLAGYDL